MAIDIPSGILCKAIASASFIPKLVFLLVEIKEVIPSGILCSIKTIADIIPSLWSLLEESFLSIFSSIVEDINIPKTMNSEHIKNESVGEKFSDSNFDDSGISDINDIDNITPLAKDSDEEIILFWFFALKKHGIIPKVVDIPDNVVIIKLNNVLFIVIYMKLFDKKCFLFLLVINLFLW